MEIADFTVAQHKYVSRARTEYKKQTLEVKHILYHEVERSFHLFHQKIERPQGMKHRMREVVSEIEGPLRRAVLAKAREAGWSFDPISGIWTMPPKVWQQFLQEIL